MKSVFVFVVFCALLLGFVNCAQKLKAIVGPSEDQVRTLISQGYDVRGTFGFDTTFALLFDDDEVLLNTIDIATLKKDDQVLIAEKSQEINTPITWLHDVQICEKFSTIFYFGSAIVLVFQSSVEDDVLQCLPSHSEILSLPSVSIEIPAKVNPLQQPFVKTPVIEALIAQVSSASILESLVTLTNINTRQSQSTGAIQAGNILAETYLKFGWNVTRVPFRADYSDNIIAEIKGSVDPSRIVIVGAHYDDRASNVNSPTDRAPGANDDGSGTVALIEIARIIGTTPGITIPYTIRLGSWSGEEQGLYGSTFYANQIKSEGQNVIAMLQADMIAIQGGSNYTFNFSTRYSTPSLIDALRLIANEYTPQLVISTSTSCCSDNQPFFNNGYPAVHYVEAYSDSQYHTVGDVINRNGFNVTTIQYVTQAILAGAATYAQIN